MVSQRFQGHGIAKRLLAAVDELALSLACCKVTLEVLEGNHVARALYIKKKMGYAGYELDVDTGAAILRFKEYSDHLPGRDMKSWVYVLENHLPWAKLAESYAFLGGLNVTLFVIGWMAFQMRDFKT